MKRAFGLLLAVCLIMFMGACTVKIDSSDIKDENVIKSSQEQDDIHPSEYTAYHDEDSDIVEYTPEKDSGDLYFYGVFRNGDKYYVRILHEYKEAPAENDILNIPLADTINASFQQTGTVGEWCPMQYLKAEELLQADKDGQIAEGAYFSYSLTDGCMDYLSEHNYYKDSDVDITTGETKDVEDVEPMEEKYTTQGLLPDVLSVRDRKYDEMPLLTSQNEVSEYALWNFLWDRTEFECYIARDLAPDEGSGHGILDTACNSMGAYYLFSAYHAWDMYTEDRGDEQGVFARVKLIFDGKDYDLQARAEALEYVMKNPVPDGGFTDFESEREYALKIHDYLACKVTYSPIGYNPAEMLGMDRYAGKQEAYTCLGKDENSTVCAGYARAFALIAHYAGINVAWVWGNETEESSHAWNILYPCDGSEPVLIDVTWDDSASLDVEGQTQVETTWFYIPLSEDLEHEPNQEISVFLDYLNGKEM